MDRGEWDRIESKSGRDSNAGDWDTNIGTRTGKSGTGLERGTWDSKVAAPQGQVSSRVTEKSELGREVVAPFAERIPRSGTEFREMTKTTPTPLTTISEVLK
jgi:hypothetical protein